MFLIVLLHQRRDVKSTFGPSWSHDSLLSLLQINLIELHHAEMEMVEEHPIMV